jgi:hypothetical protein
MATILILAVSSAAFIYLSSLSNDPDAPDSVNIASIMICGNSTDILYPELMEAFLVVNGSSWIISASFVDDSEGWENPELYEKEFSVTPEEIENISLSLHEGLNATYPSEISPSVLLESSPHIGFDIEITYTDGSWVYATTFQTGEGYIISNSGSGSPDKNLLSGIVLEPVSALDSLVVVIYTLFSNHLITS